MANKNYTIMFLPHAEANFKKIQISRRRVIFIFSSILLFLVLTGYVSYNFFILRSQLADYHEIKANEQELAQVVNDYRSRIDSAVGKMNNYNQKIKQLLKHVSYTGGGIGGELESGIGSQGYDKFSNILHDLQQNSVSEFLTDFEMKLNQFEKEEDFFGFGYSTISKVNSEKAETILQMPSISPCEGWISSRFGYRKDPFTGKRRFHEGIDICNMVPRVPIVATADGEVIQAGRDGGFGNTIVINHPLTNMKTRYAHLASIMVNVGDSIKRGDQIGTMGNTGRSTGIHLHYEVLLGKQPLPPESFILWDETLTRY